VKTALLLSGGMDSIALAWWRRPELAITVDYGQLAADAEIAAARAVCHELEIEHHTIRVDCRALGCGDMAGAATSDLASESDWWPYRNQLLLTLGAMYGVRRGAARLLLGTVASDCVHVDGTPAFVAAADVLMSLQEGRMRVEAPAAQMSTVALIQCAQVPMSLLAWAHSCHKASVACGACRGCNKYFAVLRAIQAPAHGNG
jgi:7-cyano-7-deazaguanine synthase